MLFHNAFDCNGGCVINYYIQSTLLYHLLYLYKRYTYSIQSVARWAVWEVDSAPVIANCSLHVHTRVRITVPSVQSFLQRQVN